NHRATSSPLALFVFPTAFDVVVYHANALHVRVTDSRADEFEAAPGEFLRHTIGLRCFGDDLFAGQTTRLPQGPCAGELPDEFVERSGLFLRGEKSPCVQDRRFDLA